MEEWVTVSQLFPTEEKARKVADIISVTESRLSSSQRGPQYAVETEVFEVADGWQIRWRKVLTGYGGGGCSGCGSCNNVTGQTDQSARMGKILQFKPKQK